MFCLQYFDVLRLACESHNAAATTVALDVIQKLIAYGYLRGDAARAPVARAEGSDAAAVAEGGSEAADAPEAATVPLIDIVVETICACNDFADDGVQLQVIKALLTAITTDHCEWAEHMYRHRPQWVWVAPIV